MAPVFTIRYSTITVSIIWHHSTPVSTVQHHMAPYIRHGTGETLEKVNKDAYLRLIDPFSCGSNNLFHSVTLHSYITRPLSLPPYVRSFKPFHLVYILLVLHISLLVYLQSTGQVIATLCALYPSLPYNSCYLTWLWLCLASLGTSCNCCTSSPCFYILLSLQTVFSQHLGLWTFESHWHLSLKRTFLHALWQSLLARLIGSQLTHIYLDIVHVTRIFA